MLPQWPEVRVHLESRFHSVRSFVPSRTVFAMSIVVRDLTRLFAQQCSKVIPWYSVNDRWTARPLAANKPPLAM